MTSEQNYDKVLDVYGKIKNELIKRKNVFGVGHGFKEIDGKLTDKPSIIVYVKEKLDEERIVERQELEFLEDTNDLNTKDFFSRMEMN